LLEAATNWLKVFMISPMIARQGYRVPLEQSNVYLPMNMAIMAKLGFSRAAIQKIQYLIKNYCAKVPEERKKGGGDVARYTMENAAKKRLLLMLH